MTNDEVKKIILADIRRGIPKKSIENTIECLHKICELNNNIDFILLECRSPESEFSIWNYIDKYNLSERIDFIPYYDICRDSPVKKKDCWRWITPDGARANITPDDILDDKGEFTLERQKTALFVTSFHLERQEGNTTNMRAWLRYLRSAGYRIHVVYYAVDEGIVSGEDENRPATYCDLYLKVPLRSRMYGVNSSGLNIHVDDWCGVELLESVEDMASRYAYDVAVVNYPFMSAVFDRLSAYTEKVLFTHDSFTDRNRRMMTEGYGEQGWASLDWRGEKQACLRSDVVVALQEQEAAFFRKLVDDDRKVPIVPPLLPAISFEKTPKRNQKLRIGYMGSHNGINEQNVALFLKAWLLRPALKEHSEVVLAGGICDDFAGTVKDGSRLLKAAKPVMLGRVGDVSDFFAECDVVINPERGGTGIKIKTVEAMISGMPFVCTSAGAAGIETDSRFHKAETIDALVGLLDELVATPELLETLRQETDFVQKRYVEKNHLAMANLFGPPLANDEAASRTLSDVTPLISVIIPFYGVEAYLEACLKSVVEQDYPNLEIILVDDASPDNSRKIAERFAKSDSRIRIITHAQNQGLGPARNTGAEHALGEYIFFLDSDDFMIDMSALSLLTKNALASKAQIVIGSCVNVFNDGSTSERDAAYAAKKLNAGGGFISGVEAFRAAMGVSDDYYLPMRAWGVLIDHAFYKETGLEYPNGEHEDLCHAPFLFSASNNILFLPNIVVGYRNRTDSISTSSWSSSQVRRYGAMWEVFKGNIERFSLQSLTQECAIALLGHMVWRIESNSCDDGVAAEVASVGSIFLQSVSSLENDGQLYGFLTWIRGFVGNSTSGVENLARLMSGLPAEVANGYYRSRIDSLSEAS
ncbi:glycosyltransferase [Martelella lutilitoris]|uniref:Glycosyltransferase n=1 Tax=Martelella lutilitoris TaxID=2583532 RepID=A0A7T7HL88_9HYPH|nr:glycosyltransferase [Martelella lutilitoris]QQM31253.1 glycosyltransferase [Martelella lutilitoris]